jgi:hypothetical protein
MSINNIATDNKINFSQLSVPARNFQNMQVNSLSRAYRADSINIRNFSAIQYPPFEQPTQQPPVENSSIKTGLRVAGLALGSGIAFGAVGAAIGAGFGSAGLGFAIGGGFGVLATAGILIYAITKFT